MTHLAEDRREIFLNLFYPERIRGFDVDAWVAHYAAEGATSFCLDIKDQAYVYYDSRHAPKWSILGARDLARELSCAVRKRGLKWSAYIAPSEFAFLDGEPDTADWQVRFEDGSTPPETVWNRKRYCWNSPYADLLLRILGEIAAEYHPDGFYLDGVAWPWFYERPLCYCRFCRERFRREYGAEIPGSAEKESETFVKFILARRKWNSEIAGRIRETVNAVDPEITLVTNCVFSFHDWTCSTQPETARHFDFMCAEDPPSLFRNERLPRLFSPGDTLLLKAALLRMLAGGRQGEFYSSYHADVPMEEILLNLDLYSAAGMRTSFSPLRKDSRILLERLRRIEPWIRGLAPAPEIAVHLGEDTRIGGFRTQTLLPEIPGADSDPFFQEPLAFFRCGLDLHLPLEFVSDSDLEHDNLHGARILVLPDSMVLPAGFAASFRSKVESGWNVLASMETNTKNRFGATLSDEPLFPGSGLRLAGRVRTPKPWFLRRKDGKLEFQEPVPDARAVYLSFAEGEAEEWIGENVASHAAALGFRAEDRQAHCLRNDPRSVHWPAEAVILEADRNWKVLAFLKYLDEESGEWKQSPGIVERKFGKGRIIYLALGFSLKNGCHPLWRRTLMEQLLRRLSGEEPQIRIQAPPCVKAVFFRQGRTRIIHLVNELSPQGGDAYAEERIPVSLDLFLNGPAPSDVSFPVLEDGARADLSADSSHYHCTGLKRRMVVRISG